MPAEPAEPAVLVPDGQCRTVCTKDNGISPLVTVMRYSSTICSAAEEQSSETSHPEFRVDLIRNYKSVRKSVWAVECKLGLAVVEVVMRSAGTEC